jgi:phosphoribosyl 1,2-cyclic phosphodiesterase
VRATIWGCRGSLATPGEETLRYGGNTSCVEVELDDGTLVILDAGTGIRRLGLKLAEAGPTTIHLCLTHLHLDHVEGLAFFLPLWRPTTELHVWGPPSHLRTLEKRIARYFSPPLFPVSLSDAPCRMWFHDAPTWPWQIGTASVLAAPVLHKGPTIAYRIEEDGFRLAYIPDHEPALGGLVGRSPDWISGCAVAAEADVLIHDAQYFADEYDTHTGWGHSSVDHAVAFATVSRATRLVLFHHDPLHSDAQLEALCARASELWPGDGPSPSLAHEGMDVARHP